MSALCQPKTLTETSVHCPVFCEFWFLISLRSASTLNSESRKSDLTFRSPIALILECFL